LCEYFLTELIYCQKKPENSNGKSIKAKTMRTRVPGSILMWLSGGLVIFLGV
jgi:hypothetical protein